MKTIIQRHLPLNVRYTVTDKKYIPLLDNYGCTCDNCGTLIANIATVKSINGTYEIGFDCLETFLLNNNLLDGFSVLELDKVKKDISKVIRAGKQLKETLSNNSFVTGLLFEIPTYKSDFYPFYYLKNNETKSRDNSYLKIKDIDFSFMIETLKAILPNINIITA